MRQESDFQSKFQELFKTTCITNNTDLISFLINKGPVNWGDAFTSSIHWHQLDSIELLCKLSKDDKHDCDLNYMLKYACDIDDTTMIKLALKLGATHGDHYGKSLWDGVLYST